MSACMVCDGVSGAGGGGGDEDERAVVGSGSPRPPRRQYQGGTLVPTPSARHRVGPSSVAVLPVAERVRPIVAAPTAYPAPVAVGCRHPVPPVGYRTGYKCADKCSFVPNCPKLIFSFVPKRAPKLDFLSFVPFQKPKISVASGTALERLWPFQMTLILLRLELC